MSWSRSPDRRPAEGHVKPERRAWALVGALALIAAACSGGATATPTPVPPTATPAPATPAPATSAPAASTAGGSLTIYAASSLTAAFTEMQTAYEAANPGTTL